MAKETLDQKIDTLTSVVEKGFAASDTKFAAVAEDIARMATKDDIANLATKDDVRKIVRHEIGELVPSIVAHELKPLRQELQQDIEGINDRLDTLEALYSNLRGVTKEIDEIRAEVRAIQKHLGIGKKLAA